jgi:WD40 repeat protein
VAFAPSGGELVVSGEDGSVGVWNPETGKIIQTLEAYRSDSKPGIVADLDVSPDGSQIATIRIPDTTMSVWDRATGEELFTIRLHGFAENLDWSPDGEHLAIAAIDEAVARIVDRTGEEVAAFHPGAGVFDVQFSPDGSLLATATAPTGRPNPLAQRVKIWDWEREEVVTEIPVFAEGMAFHPSGRRIAIAYGGQAGIWDVESGRKLRTLAGHEDVVWDVQFSPDGSALATGSFDNTVRLWDASSGVQRLVLRGHEFVVGRLAFSPDGSKLASGAGDGTARVWALDLDDLIDIARDELTRGLTQSECRQYLHQAC